MMLFLCVFVGFSVALDLKGAAIGPSTAAIFTFDGIAADIISRYPVIVSISSFIVLVALMKLLSVIRKETNTPDVVNNDGEIYVDNVLSQEYSAYPLDELNALLKDNLFQPDILSNSEFQATSFAFLEKINEIQLLSGFSLLGYYLFLDNKENCFFIKGLLDKYFSSKSPQYIKGQVASLCMNLDLLYTPNLKDDEKFIFFIKTIYGWMYKEIPSNPSILKMLGTIKEKGFSSFHALLQQL